jgi:acetyltransferase-like isoleucine patch superfamily enzyme
MPKLVTIEPYTDAHGNTVVGTPFSVSKSSITFKGKNNRLEIADGVSLDGVNFVFDSNNGQITIGENSVYKGMLRVGFGSRIAIGRALSVTARCYISAMEGASVTIGDDCMFASANEIRADDAHPIFDATTKKRLNKSVSIVIGDHVWLSGQVTVSKGASIGSGSVIGYRSYVRHAIPKSCIAAGAPAKVVREGIVWDKKHLGPFADGSMEELGDLGRPFWQE